MEPGIQGRSNNTNLAVKNTVTHVNNTHIRTFVLVLT